MLSTAFRDMRPFAQLVFAAFIILVSFLAFMIISFIVAIPVFGFEAATNLSGLTQLDTPESITILKYFQTVQAIGLFIVPALVLGYLFHGKMKEYLYLNRSFNTASLFLILLVMFFAGPFINFIGEINANLKLPDWMSGVENWMLNAEEDAERITKAFLDVKTIGGLLFNIFMIAFLPAVGEELLFRGVVQRIFTNMTRSHHWDIWIAAILFSALHMQFYGFIPRVILGAIFGYMLVWSGSMWLPMLGHFLNNAIAVTGMFFINTGKLNPELEEIGSTGDSYYAAAISVGLLVLFMVMIKKQNTGNELPKPTG